jgi:transcriptional regulator with XRE-family HTH domain
MSRSTHNHSIQRFGEKLRALRTQRGLTLKQLAAALGHAAHGHISELECGKKMPTVDFVLSVAQLFGVTTDELLRDDLELRIPGGKSKRKGYD